MRHHGIYARAPRQIQRANSSIGSGTTATATLSTAADANGNTVLVAIVAYTATSSASQANTPSGWTLVYGPIASSVNGTTIAVYVKQSAGETGLTYTTSVAASNFQVELQEWSGLRTVASGTLFGATTVHIESASALTTWNPASLTADVNRAVYIAAAALAAGSGTVTSDWADTTGTRGTGSAAVINGWKQVNKGVSFDTAATWTNARNLAGVVFYLRGA